MHDLQGITPDTSSNMDFSGADDNDDVEYIQIPDVPSTLKLPTSLSPSSDHTNGQDSLPLPPLVPVSTPKNYPPAKRLRNDDVESNGSPNGPPLDEKDDDFHFLMSLHTYMGKLKNGQKLRVRMKIQDMLYKELFNDEEESDENGINEKQKL